MTIRNGKAVREGGGGILNQDRLTLVNCNIRDNLAEIGGGVSNNGELRVTGSTVSGNTVDNLDALTGIVAGSGIYRRSLRFRGANLVALLMVMIPRASWAWTGGLQ